MYIRDLRVRNYMIHQDTRVQLLPLTVFVGPNGGGKSALFDALLNFSMLSRGNIRQAFGPYPYSFRATLSRAAGPPRRIGYQVAIAKSPAETEAILYEIDYSQTGAAEGEPQYAIFTERLLAQPGNTVLFDRSEPDAYSLSAGLELENDRSIFSAFRLRQMAGGPAPAEPLVAYCTRQISRFNKFRLDPTILAQTSRLPDISTDGEPALSPRIGYHGEDLAATLYFLSETNAPELASICDRVREIDPAFDRFEFNAVGTDRIAFSVVHSDRRERVPSVRLSSGTLTYIGLITLVSTPNRPALLMIEEPENGLTPQAVKEFYKAVRSLARGENPDAISQVLLSSHSPFVICEAWNGEDRDFIYQVKIEDGCSKVRKFSEAVETHRIHLAKDSSGKRTILGLKNAEEIMSGYMA